VTPKLTLEAYLGQHVPDRTPLDEPVFCPLPDGGGLVTVPFVVYGEEQAKRIKPAYVLDSDGHVTREVIPGLTPRATVFGYDERGLYLAWTDANRSTVVAVDKAGRTVWRHRVSGFGCARQTRDGVLAIGSAAGELRRLDKTGALLHDLDGIFANRPFPGPHGIDLVGPRTYLADPDVTHSVWAIDTMGNPLQRLGSADPHANRSGAGLLCYPFDVAVLDDGSQWVAEHGRKRLSGFDDAGQPLGHVVAAELGAEALCTTRLFTDWERQGVAVFARRVREVWLFVFEPS
jgi:hypothetical protein